jgi:hypothetical protein
MQHQNPDLSLVPRDAKGIKWQPISQKERNQDAEARSKCQLAQTLNWLSLSKCREDCQCGAAGAKAKQGNTDNHESKMVELCHREQACQVDLKGQGGGREQKKTQPDDPFVTGLGTHEIAEAFGLYT